MHDALTMPTTTTTATKKTGASANIAPAEFYIEKIAIPETAQKDIVEIEVPNGSKVISAGLENPAYAGETIFLYAIASVSESKSMQKRKVRLVPTKVIFKGTELLTNFVFVDNVIFKTRVFHVFVEMA